VWRRWGLATGKGGRAPWGDWPLFEDAMLCWHKGAPDLQGNAAGRFVICCGRENHVTTNSPLMVNFSDSVLQSDTRVKDGGHQNNFAKVFG